MWVWFRDLQSNWGAWIAIAVTAWVSAASCALAVSMLRTDSEAAGPLGGTLLFMAVCAVVLIILSQMKLIIDEHQPVYQSWRMVGMPAWMIVGLVTVQVVAVSAASSLIGVHLVRPFLKPAAEALRGEGIPMEELTLGFAEISISIVICVASAILGAILPMRRIFKPHSQSHSFWVALRGLIAVVVVAGGVFAGFEITEPSDVLSWSMGMVVLVSIALPWLMPVIDRWASIFGIAGTNVRVRRRFSIPQILPWVFFGGLMVSVGSVLRIAKAADPGSTISSWQVFAVMLGPVVLPSVTGAVMTPLIMRHRIAADLRALQLAGADVWAGARIQIGEALVLTCNAALVVGTQTFLSVWLMNSRLDDVPTLSEIWWSAFVLIFLSMAGLLTVVKLAVVKGVAGDCSG